MASFRPRPVRHRRRRRRAGRRRCPRRAGRRQRAAACDRLERAHRPVPRQRRELRPLRNSPDVRGLGTQRSHCLAARQGRSSCRVRLAPRRWLPLHRSAGGARIAEPPVCVRPNGATAHADEVPRRPPIPVAGLRVGSGAQQHRDHRRGTATVRGEMQGRHSQVVACLDILRRHRAMRRCSRAYRPGFIPVKYDAAA